MSRISLVSFTLLMVISCAGIVTFAQYRHFFGNFSPPA
jgi:hypothetical protein